MKKSFQKWHIAALLTVIFLPIYTGLGYVLWTRLPVYISKNIEAELSGKMLVGLILILLLLVSYIVFLKFKLSKEANINDYKLYATSNGLFFYQLKKDTNPEKTWYCTNCMDIHKRASIVHSNYREGKYFSWYCPNCKTNLEPFKYDTGNDGSLINIR